MSRYRETPLCVGESSLSDGESPLRDRPPFPSVRHSSSDDRERPTYANPEPILPSYRKEAHYNLNVKRPHTCQY
ncbi:hypothetical protein H9659_11730 [Sporosarcina sp. Sa3CUA8]|uniref:Uncharacterized protein n=1 Tax=Sporosarcina gallistercoris TaxID=2762245 RepID=A0ABR8PLQ5_9BACL|nr:hypothetical protein [Sporosarcina gallistercoris]